MLHGDRLALIERRRGSEMYYLLPGVTVNEGESWEEAARRETAEELGLDVDIGPLLAEVVVTRATGILHAALLPRNHLGGTSGRGPGRSSCPHPMRLTAPIGRCGAPSRTAPASRCARGPWSLLAETGVDRSSVALSQLRNGRRPTTRGAHDSP